MADKRPNVVLVTPGGIGRVEALASFVKPGTWLTALDDGALSGVKRQFDHLIDEIEVIPFGSALSRFSGMCGNSGGARLTIAQMRAIVSNVAADLPEESLLCSAAKYPGAATALCEAITELHYHRITAEDLTAVAAQLDGHKSQLFADLAAVETSVRELAAEFGKEFGVDRAKFCLDQGEDRQLPVRHLVVIAGSEYIPIYFDFLRWVARNGVKVDILVEGSASASAGLFLEQKLVIESLTGKTPTSQSAPSWTKALFSDQVADVHPDVTILQTGDPLAEAEAAVRQILSLMRDGKKESEIGIFARDTETYIPLLISAARRLGLRVAGTLTVPLLTNGFAAKTMDILGVFASRDVRNLARAVQSTYFGLDEQARGYVESTTRQAHMDRQDPWEALQKLVGTDEHAPAWLMALLVWREEALAADRTLGQWCEHLRALWDGSEVLDRVHLAESETSARDLNAMTVMQRSLRDQSLASVPGEKINFARFVKEVEVIWGLESVAWSDLKEGVRICTTTSHLSGFDHLLVLGMLEGTFPRRRREHPVLSDSLRRDLAKLLPNRPLLRLSFDQAKGERDEFIRICASARVGLTLSYPLTDEDRDNVPAIFLDEMDRVCKNGVNKIHIPRSQIVPELEACTSSQDLAIRRALDQPRRQAEVSCLVSDEAREIVRIDPEKSVRPQELSAAFNCSFRAMASKLGVSPGTESARLKVFGSIPEKIGLTRIDDLSTARENLKAAIAAKIDELAPTSEQWELTLMQDASGRVIDDWIKKENNSRENWSMDPSTATGPVQFGSEALGQSFKLPDGSEIVLEGSVSSIVQLGDVMAAVLFGRHAPEFRGGWEESPDELLSIGLHLLSLRTSHPPAVIIDPLSGSRRVYLLARHPVIERVHEDLGIVATYFSPDQSRDLLTTKRTLGEKVGGFARRAADVLKKAEMKPTSGPHCENCQFADLCRNHQEFGENAIPMAGEGF